MRRRDLIGRPVLELDSGRYLGEAREIIVDLNNGTVVGIVVQRGRWFRSTWFLPFDNVQSCGDGAITVEDDQALISRGEFAQRRGTGQHQLVGKRVLNDQGHDLGTLDDIFFDPGSCEVTGYQISSGVIQDLLEGKKSIPAVPLMLGYDAVIISEESELAARIAASRRTDDDAEADCSESCDESPDEIPDEGVE